MEQYDLCLMMRHLILKVVRQNLTKQPCMWIAKEYTVAAPQAAEQLRMWSPILRPIAVRFLDSCVKTQAMVAEARRVMKPVIDKRYKARADAAAANVKTYSSLPRPSSLCLLLSETLFQISKHPNIIPALREEIITINRSDGWEKTAFYKMKLLDSVIKETQRFKPHALISMTRLVKESFVLSDGTPLKVALVSILRLIKYDFELPADVSPQIYENGLALVSDPLAKLRFRRRAAEIDLDNV
ncbi:hypothetical protein G3M48_005725 [Beauveria asiatica]|uniref:Uncharacterized protein n=1 Tax=Beauveria asiatica TaxID=1069075 RepID=A0AAW0RQK0_9HYPO